MRPFEEEVVDENIVIRTFYPDVDEFELKWHWDEEDRIVYCIENNGWQFQFDNELPFIIDGHIKIPKGVYHRVLKGDGLLKVKIYKISV